MKQHAPIQGIEVTLGELIKVRPAKGMTGFAPTGKVNTHQWGSYQSAFKGRGMEFAESRAYQVGDDVKYIDWRITARTGKTHTKLFQEERERPIQLLVDMRMMMQFGTRTRFKSNMVAIIAAQLAWVGFDGGDRVGAHILTPTGIKGFKGARTRRAVLRFLNALSVQTLFYPATLSQQNEHLQNQQTPDTTTNATHENSLSEGIHRLRHLSYSGSLVFVLTDGYDFDTQASQELVRLSKHAHVTLIQVNDPMDSALPSKAGLVSDGIANINLASLTEAQLDSYAQDFNTRQRLIHKICAQHGITLHELCTTDDPKSILYQQARTQSRRVSKARVSKSRVSKTTITTNANGSGVAV